MKFLTSRYIFSSNKNATLASYEVAQLVEKSGKAIAEELILPTAIVLCKRMLGRSIAKLVGSVPLRKILFKERITEMSANIDETLFIRLSISDRFALQLDTSTDIVSKSSRCYTPSTAPTFFEFENFFCFLFSSCIR